MSDSCFQLKSQFNVDARAPSTPLLNFPFKLKVLEMILQTFNIVTIEFLKKKKKKKKIHIC